MFAQLKATLLKVDLRDGKKVLVFETNARLTGGELEALSEMIKKEVILGVDSQVISYRIRKNARTDKPLVSYKVDHSGVVEEVKEQGEQMELDLGLGAEKVQVKEEVLQISLEVVQEFINAGLAPRLPDMEHDLPDIIRRHTEGESYARLAAELDMSTGRLAELLEDYYGEIAPLAAKWDEWRKSKVEQAVAPVDEDASDDDDEEGLTDAYDIGNEDLDDEATHEHGSDSEFEDVDATSGSADDLSDWEQEILGDRDSQTSEKKIDREDVETFILNEKPTYEDIPYDFPVLLSRFKNGETWREIANSIGMTSGQLAAAWSKYKKRVADHLGGAA